MDSGAGQRGRWPLLARDVTPEGLVGFGLGGAAALALRAWAVEGVLAAAAVHRDLSLGGSTSWGPSPGTDAPALLLLLPALQKAFPVLSGFFGQLGLVLLLLSSGCKVAVRFIVSQKSLGTEFSLLLSVRTLGR